MAVGDSPTLTRAVQLALEYLGFGRRRKPRITEEVVQAVRADGRIEVGGDLLKTSGIYRGAQAGDKVDVLWSRPAATRSKQMVRAVILKHQARRGGAPAGPPLVAGAVLEELFIADQNGTSVVCFRNFDRQTVLNLAAAGFLGAPTVVQWGQSQNAFYVRAGGTYGIFRFNRAEGSTFAKGVDPNSKLSLVYTWTPATDSRTLATLAPTGSWRESVWTFNGVGFTEARTDHAFTPHTITPASTEGSVFGVVSPSQHRNNGANLATRASKTLTQLYLDDRDHLIAVYGIALLDVLPLGPSYPDPYALYNDGEKANTEERHPVVFDTQSGTVIYNGIADGSSMLSAAGGNATAPGGWDRSYGSFSSWLASGFEAFGPGDVPLFPQTSVDVDALHDAATAAFQALPLVESWTSLFANFIHTVGGFLVETREYTPPVPWLVRNSLVIGRMKDGQLTVYALGSRVARKVWITRYYDTRFDSSANPQTFTRPVANGMNAVPQSETRVTAAVRTPAGGTITLASTVESTSSGPAGEFGFYDACVGFTMDRVLWVRAQSFAGVRPLGEIVQGPLIAVLYQTPTAVTIADLAEGFGAIVNRCLRAVQTDFLIQPQVTVDVAHNVLVDNGLEGIYPIDAWPHGTNGITAVAYDHALQRGSVVTADGGFTMSGDYPKLRRALPVMKMAPLTLPPVRPHEVHSAYSVQVVNVRAVLSPLGYFEVFP